jgi:hypothetical protein
VRPPFLFDSGNGVVRGFSFQKVPNCDRHEPRSHIDRVGPIKTTDQVPAEIVQIGIEDGGALRPLFVVAKNLAVANCSDRALSTHPTASRRSSPSAIASLCFATVAGSAPCRSRNSNGIR